MKNKIEDLRDHMFMALERLSDPDLTEDGLKKEIERSKAISEVGKVIVESAKTEVLYAKLAGKPAPKKFLQLESGEEEEEPKKIQRPPAKYANKQVNEPYEFAK